MIIDVLLCIISNKKEKKYYLTFIYNSKLRTQSKSSQGMKGVELICNASFLFSLNDCLTYYGLF
jgi:hypothetical protein